MKKFFALILVLVLMASVQAFGAEERPDINPSPLDSFVNKGVGEGEGYIIRSPGSNESADKKKDDKTEQGNHKPESTSSDDIQSFHAEAKYKIVNWKVDTKNKTLSLDYAEKGKKNISHASTIKGKDFGDSVQFVVKSLRRPVQFTVPDDCEVDVWYDKGYNYRILDDGSLEELPHFEYTENGKKKKGRKAYSGDTVLVLDGSTMTVWAFK